MAPATSPVGRRSCRRSGRRPAIRRGRPAGRPRGGAGPIARRSASRRVRCLHSWRARPWAFGVGSSLSLESPDAASSRPTPPVAFPGPDRTGNPRADLGPADPSGPPAITPLLGGRAAPCGYTGVTGVRRLPRWRTTGHPGRVPGPRSPPGSRGRRGDSFLGPSRRPFPRGRNMERLPKQLVRQLGFLRHSCELFDRGNQDEAIRIATCIRVLLHDAKSNRPGRANRGQSWNNFPPRVSGCLRPSSTSAIGRTCPFSMD